MANVLRYQTGSSRFRPFVGGLEPLDDRGEPMPAPPNASGILERNVIPEGDGGQFQLTPPGDLSMQQRDDTPTLDRLTMRNAPEPRLDYGPRRYSMVEGLDEVTPPMETMGPPPARAWGGPSSQDASDSRRARRLDRAQGVANAAGRLAMLFSRGKDDPMPDLGPDPTGESRWSAPVTERIDARRAMGAEAQGGKLEAEQAAYDRQVGEDERALNADYRQTLMRSMDTNADRREFEMGRRTDADSRLYDPEHPVAQQRREFLRRIMASAPEIAAGLEGQDLDALGSAELRQITSETLRRIGQTPNRLRQADVDAMMRMAAELDAGDDAVSAAPPVAEPVQDVRRGGGPRRAGAPAAVAAPTAEAPPPSGLTDRSGAAAPWAGRDRTVAQMNAERLMERNPGEYTWREATEIARSLERSRTRSAGSLAGGIDTQSREAQIDQVGQTGVVTQRDIDKAREVLVPAASQRRGLARVARSAAALSDAQFMAAMNDSAAVRRLLGGYGAEQFASDFRAMTNSELRQQSGAAVTDSEAQRFFAALAAHEFTSKAAFMHALNRVNAEIQANVAGMTRPEVRAAWAAQTRGGR